MPTTQNFRNTFTEFASEVTYPNLLIEVWMDIASKMLREERWSTLFDFGTYLFVAHNLVLQSKAVKDATSGRVPGSSAGPISSKSVGPASVSYASEAGIEPDSGHWNDTIYGRRYIRLARMLGAGPLTPLPAVGPGSYDGFWPGVML